jgi:hypothetical protein
MLPRYVPSMPREHEVAKDEDQRPRKWQAGRVYLDMTDKNILHMNTFEWDKRP